MKIDFPRENQIPALKGLWKDCFEDPEAFIDGFFSAGFSSGKCRVMTAGETVAAALYWLDVEYRGQKMAYIYAVATDPEYRGRGLCRALMENTHELLEARGYAAALLMPGEPGLRKMYGGFGYRDCCGIREFSSAAGEPLPLQEISWQEYENQRRSYLPPEGAQQEGLVFLGTYASFYQGRGILLCAVEEGESLLCLELLGDEDAAPGILAALNCGKGTFRTPGKGKQTVMCLPLKPDAEMPGYVGLTFD